MQMLRQRARSIQPRSGRAKLVGLRIAMKSSQDRKQVAREYKARQSPRGIFALRCTSSGEVWIGSSMDLRGAKNALWFFLGSGQHKNETLQARWHANGEQAFQFEVIEEIDADVSALSIADVLKARRIHWTAQLDARTL
jgi:hypothetical protein